MQQQQHSHHEGHLFKQGQVFRQWKRRFFVLDAANHRVRYYDGRQDAGSVVRGEIDLADVRAVRLPGRAPMGAPKRVPDAAFVELETCQRTFRFYAEDVRQSAEWVEKINNLISQ